MTSVFASGAFTTFHVLISLAGVLTGLIALLAFARAIWMPQMTLVFLATTLATTMTGFLFPFRGLTPALAVGFLSTLVLFVAIGALYVRRPQGRVRTLYAWTAVLSLYLNLFVLVVQSFQKVPLLHALAPNGSGPLFAAAQGLVLIACACIGYRAVRVARGNTLR
jgi:hypothetical protein